MKVKISAEEVYSAATVTLGFVLFGFMIFCFTSLH